MPKCRQALADALARLVFNKPLAALDPSERAELNFLRALDLDGDEQKRAEQNEPERPKHSRAVTLH